MQGKEERHYQKAQETGEKKRPVLEGEYSLEEVVNGGGGEKDLRILLRGGGGGFGFGKN